MSLIPESMRAFLTPVSASNDGERITLRQWLAVVLIPVLMMALCTGAFLAPKTNHGTAMAAVVNNDEPVTVNGQTLPMGRQLAAQLTHADDSAYTWVLTDAADADSGLDSGAYAAKVTIPKDFSERIAASAKATTSGDVGKVAQGLVRFDASTASGVLDPDASGASAQGIRAELDDMILTTYLENVYTGFNTLHDGIATASDGAKDLHGGTSRLADGIGQLKDGSGKLVTGSDRLADGLEDAAKQTKTLPESTRQLADGARQVADGNRQIADAVAPAANQAIRTIDTTPSATGVISQLRPLAQQCRDADAPADLCDGIEEALSQARTAAQSIDGAKADARNAIVTARDSVNRLADGSRQVADGAKQLADATPALQTGIASAAAGARQLADGTADLDTGVAQLGEGAGKLDDGSKRLADGLGDALGQIPTFSRYARTRLADTVAQPSRIDASAPSTGVMAVTFLITLALWGLALATYVFTRALPRDILTSRKPTWQLVSKAVLPGTLMAVTGAAAIGVIAWMALRLDAGHGMGMLLAAIVTAFTFGAINQALAGSFGQGGRIASMLMMVLTVATGVVSTIPAWLAGVVPLLPTHAATTILRAVVTGSGVAAAPIATLVVWWLAGFAICIGMTARRRMLDPRQLRPRTLADGLD
ncbi:ABC transporter permease [Bifidobacterium sp. 82T24]|uniref:ABC transporter permease n=1 Tax=Bifidobacterium pluvialisilvae TaxID=2834436 RepID=UPI001C55D35E|nr:ABC transporter permease [Bifidobacterium pluvialisilvae]MBW3088215.1 ABC transporter permease [Bifidobacterium pluvialisilvae]